MSKCEERQRWSEIKQQVDEKIGSEIEVYIKGRKNTHIRVKATPIKTYANFVLADVHMSRRYSYRECFLYADFITGEQPSNGVAA